MFRTPILSFILTSTIDSSNVSQIHVSKRPVHVFDQVVIFFYLTSMMNFYLLLPRDDLDLSTLRKLYINFFDDEDARDRIFSYHRRCKKKKEKTAPMIKIS